jgi:hypothetical protein
VSTYGGVKSLKYFSHTGKVGTLKQNRSKLGYLSVALYKNGKIKRLSTHRLVLEAFMGQCPNGMECAHNDGNKQNNKLKNLRWDTPSNNHGDKLKHGTWQGGENNGSAKLTWSAVKKNKRNDIGWNKI